MTTRMTFEERLAHEAWRRRPLAWIEIQLGAVSETRTAHVMSVVLADCAPTDPAWLAARLRAIADELDA